MTPAHQPQSTPDPLMAFARRWWWLLCIGVILGGIGAVVYHRMGPLPYQSTALVQILSPTGSNPTADASLTRSAASNFAAEASSSRIYGLVSEELKGTLDLSVSDLERMERNGTLNVRARVGSNFITIDVTDPDPERAQLIANTLAQVFVDDVTFRSDQIYLARQAQLDEQIQFTRQQLATAALRQREIDLKAQLRNQETALLTLQVNYQQELARQSEADANTSGTITPTQLAAQAEIRSKLLEIIGRQVTDVEANIAALTEDIAEVQAELATLPQETDNSLSAAFATAYSLQLTALTQRYVTDQIQAFTASPPVVRYGDASPPIVTTGIKKLGMFGVAGGAIVAAALGFAFDYLRRWRAARSRSSTLADTGSSQDALSIDITRLLKQVDAYAVHGDHTHGRAALNGSSHPHSKAATDA
jgi:uncharacterized protein involved in exopolysaccharide biosynthesis